MKRRRIGCHIQNWHKYGGACPCSNGRHRKVLCRGDSKRQQPRHSEDTPEGASTTTHHAMPTETLPAVEQYLQAIELMKQARTLVKDDDDLFFDLTVAIAMASDARRKAHPLA